MGLSDWKLPSPTQHFELVAKNYTYSVAFGVLLGCAVTTGGALGLATYAYTYGFIQPGERLLAFLSGSSDDGAATTYYAEGDGAADKEECTEAAGGGDGGAALLESRISLLEEMLLVSQVPQTNSNNT